MLELAARLWDARKHGSVVQPEDISELTTIEEAYAIQARIVQLSGHVVRGFKVGSTSKEAQQLLGTTEPGSGPILGPYLHTSPARVPIVALQMPAVEGEFAFRLGRDLAPREAAYASVEVAQAVDAVAGAIEVVGTRIAGGLAGKGRFLVTADGGANIALVTGPWTTDWHGLDLKVHRVEISINGKQRGQGEGARALGDPMNVLVWLANQRSRFGRGLRRGDIVSTGTCTGLDSRAIMWWRTSVLLGTSRRRSNDAACLCTAYEGQGVLKLAVGRLARQRRAALGLKALALSPQLASRVVDIVDAMDDP